MRELSILAAAREEPARDCLVEAGRAWSYAEVAARVRGAIENLRERGLPDGEPVALVPEPTVDSVVTSFALFELGAPAVLVHPRLTERERKEQIASSGAVDLLEGVPSVATGAAADGPGASLSPSRPLAVVSTSGSSGRPRGAVLSRSAFVASARAHARNLGWAADDRWLLQMPPAHIGGLSILTRSLIARRCVVLSPGPFDARSSVDIIERERVTLLSVVPTMLRRFLELEPAWAPPESLRAVLVGGAAFPDSLRERAVAARIPVHATYGLTEACSQVCTQSAGQAGGPGSGSPLDGVSVRIEGGEIQIRGEVLMDRYVGDVAAAWTEDGWFRTGDHGRFFREGELLVEGRLDDRIVTGGENVAPEEVERWLEAFPGIRGACVFAEPDPEWGERVVAAIAIDPERYEPAALQAAMVGDLAPFKRPKAIAELTEMPVNRSGKVDRRAVAQIARAKLVPI